MPIPIESIVVGRCYEMTSNQIRKVIEVAPPRVRWSNWNKDRWGSVNNGSLAAFAAAVRREVPCP